jgi:hypothetical protein
MQTATSKLWAEATKLATQRPLHTIGLVAAVGYLLGGGLLSPLTGRLLALGVRLQMQRTMRRLHDTLEDRQP